MPPQPGEETLATLFADIHYFLSPPTYKPCHHRFDKASYVYLHWNAAQTRGRLEVANNAGTPDQDAFTGFLDAVQISYNYNQPNLLTITIDQTAAHSGSPQLPPQWQLPSFDQKNENKYLYKLHTVDIYFYTAENAALFLSSTQKFLSPELIKVLNAPAPPPSGRSGDVVSPVVQKLEQAAIATPYESKHDSISSGVSLQQTASAGSYQPPGPGSHALNSAGSPPPPSTGQPPVAEFAPIPYNPAAPAAPEPIKHREKTPPPPEDDNGTGLKPTTSINQVTPVNAQYTPSYTPSYPQQTPQVQSYSPSQPQPQPYIPGQPQRQNSIPISPPQAGSFAPPPSAASPPVQGAVSPYQTPTLPATSASAFSPPPTQIIQPSPPPGGYSTFSYSATGPSSSTAAPAGQQPYNVHSQVYRPTQAEAGHMPYGGTAGPGQAAAPGRFEQRAGKLEKGVNSFLKRLDKKF